MSAVSLAGRTSHGEVEAVIRDARRRQFRRRLVLGVALAATGIACALYFGLFRAGGGAGSGSQAPSGAALPLALPRAPYAGLACGNAAGQCDRVGLAIWVRHPARNVTALVHGQTIRLSTAAGGSGAYAKHFFWQGFFHDPYVADLASGGGNVPVRIRVVSANGSLVVGRTTVYVSQGYG